ncbi:MAG: bacteriocin [Bacteroidota bacterium]
MNQKKKFKTLDIQELKNIKGGTANSGGSGSSGGQRKSQMQRWQINSELQTK